MSLLFPMFSFALAMSISPGPANMVVLSSGVNHGIRKTLPYASGATLGFTLLLLFIGLGFSQFIQTYPFLLTYLSIGGSLFIVYMGYKIASSKPEITVKEKKAPKFYEGFLLQWLNPKAWIACLSGVSIFSSVENHTQFLIFASLYFFVCYGSFIIWAILGDKISFLLNNTTRLRFFNFFMGLLLILTAGYIMTSI